VLGLVGLGLVVLGLVGLGLVVLGLVVLGLVVIGLVVLGLVVIGLVVLGLVVLGLVVLGLVVLGLVVLGLVVLGLVVLGLVKLCSDYFRGQLWVDSLTGICFSITSHKYSMQVQTASHLANRQPAQNGVLTDLVFRTILLYSLVILF